MKPYSAYLFDADGTLIDTAELIYRSFAYTCKTFADRSVSRREVIANIGIPLRPHLELFLGPLSDDRAQEIMQAHMGFQLSIYKEYVSLYDDVAPALQRLKRCDKRCVIVTSRRVSSLKLYLEHTGIYRFFDFFVTPESTEKHKPDPQPAIFAARQLGIEERDAIFIGDSPFDIECGSRAGMDTAYITRLHQGSQTPAIAPTYMLTSLLQLCD